MRQRRLSLPGLARRRLAHQKGVAAALALGLIAAVALASTVELVQAVAAEAGLHSTLTSLGDTGAITVEQFNTLDPAAFEAFQRDAGDRVEGALGSHVRRGAQFATLGPYFPNSLNGQAVSFDAGNPQPTLAYHRDIAGHVRTLSGELPVDAPTPSGDFPASLSRAAAETFQLKVGDRYCVSFARRAFSPQTLPSVCMKVAAVWQARDAHDPFWGGSPPQLQLVLGRDDFYARDNQRLARTGPVAGRYYSPDLDTLNAQNAPEVARRMNELRGYFTVRRQGFFATSVDTSIRAFLDRQRVASFTGQLIAAALLMVALYSVAFVAGHFLDAQARELAVLRARGWRRRRVWSLLMLQLAGLAIVAVPAGLLVAALATTLLAEVVFGSSAPRLTASDVFSMVPALAGALAAGLVLLGGLAAGAARRDVMELRRAGSRPSPAPWWRSRKLDLVLAVVALPLLAESRIRGSGQVRAVAASDDPFSLLFPALALGLLAVACLRLLPLASRLAGRLGGGVAASLAGWQLRRRPGQHGSLALLLTFAVALGVFSTVYAATEHRNTLDRAAYRAGADLKVTYTINQEPLPFRDVISGLKGVTASSAAYRSTGSPGATIVQATILGVDPFSLPNAAWSRDDLYGMPMSGVLRPLASHDPDGLSLPGRPAGISLWVFSSGLDTHLVANLADLAGHACACDLGPLDYAGWRRLHVPISFSEVATSPLRLRSLSMAQSTNGRTDGQIALSDLAADDRVVERFDSHGGWWSASVATSPQASDLSPSDSRQRDGRPTVPVDVHLERGELLLRPPASSKPLPALLSSATLQTLGVGLNQAFPMHVDSYGVQVTAVGLLDYFPSLYPDQEQFIVLPLDSLLGRLAHEGSPGAWPNELWVKLSGDSTATAQRLRAVGQVLELDQRRELETAALSDPLRLALEATLAVGFVAALATTIVGFGLHFLVAARVRLGEYAILRANGLSAAMVARSLAIEQAVLLGYSLCTGAVLGVVVSFAVLPSVQLGSDSADYVPPTVVTLNPPALLGALAVVLAGGILVGWLASRAGSRLHLLDELRQLG